MTASLLLAVNAWALPPLPHLKMKPAYPRIHLSRPVWMQEAPDGTHRLFVVEQRGRVLILPRDHQSDATHVFLDITDRHPYQQNEEGLLGFAFHPQFKSNGKFYIYYTQHHPRRSVLSEFRVSKTDPDRADLSTERILMQIPEPYWNHNGGVLLFGPDGDLYISLGDGGSAGDPHNYAQNLGSLLGKILRINVDGRSGDLPYAIPSDNPFVGRKGARPEIWAYGLRNVWRMSFDRKTGTLWAGNVGQDKWEMVEIIRKGGNYGWSIREGYHPFKPEPPGFTYLKPVIEYPHSTLLEAEAVFHHSPGTSVTGGYVYRGKRWPQLDGVYVYADFTLGTFWGLRYDQTHHKLLEHGILLKQPKNISSFAEDNQGELYVLAFDGRIYHLVPASHQ